MPLSEDARRELAGIDPQRRCDRLAQLSGLFHTAGSLHLRSGGAFSLHLDVAESVVARRAFGLLRKLAVEAEIRTYRQRALRGSTRYQLHVPGTARALEVLVEAGVVSRGHGPLDAPPRRVVGRSCCRRAYLRGAFLGGGSVSGPRLAHLEIRSASRAGAELVVWAAAQEGVALRLLDRDRHAVAYAKAAEAIADALALVGAGEAALEIDEYWVIADARARANRLANADHANLVRSIRAAHAQAQAIAQLRERGRLEALASALREAAELRLRHPSAALSELAAKCRPPVTKAAMQRRLARLLALAGEEGQPP